MNLLTDIFVLCLLTDRFPDHPSEFGGMDGCIKDLYARDITGRNAEICRTSVY